MPFIVKIYTAFQTINLSRWTASSRQIYLHDDWQITPALALGLGFRSVHFETMGGGIGADQAPYGKLTSKNNFLPHLSLLWHRDTHNDVFVDAAQTQSAFRISPRANIGYSASPWGADDQNTYDDAAKHIKPERDTTITLGGHHSSGRLLLSYDAYFSLVENRLIAAQVGGFNSLHAPLQSVTTIPASHILGGDLSAHLPIGKYLTVNQSLSVSRFRYGGNVVNDGQVVALSGKAQPGYPEISLLSRILFHYQHIQAGATATVYLNQPFSYTNDLMGKNFFNTTAFIAYEKPRTNTIPALNFRLDVYNVLNSKMIGNLGVDGYPFSGDQQTMQRSAPRQVLFTVGTKF